LRPFHPMLSPSATDGCANVQGERSGIVLRLVPGATARFRPPAVSDPRLRVLLFRGAVGPPPVSEHVAVLQDGVARFGGFAPGAYVAWFDLPGYAPVARTVDLSREDENDLGEVRPGEGTTLRVERVQEGDRIGVRVDALDPPVYTRGSSAPADAAEVLVRGLGSGRFRVQIYIMRKVGGGTSFDRTIEADGRLPVTLRAEPR